MSTATAVFLDTIEASWENERTRADVLALCAATGQSVEAALTDMALRLAQGYAQKSLAHEVAMGKAAALYDTFFTEGRVPEALYEVYWALDEAEYRSEHDGPEDDAPEARCRRAVQAVLERFAPNDA